MDELKPCPFCGKPPKITTTLDEHPVVTSIRCENKFCRGEFTILDIIKDNRIIINHWNTRPREDELENRLRVVSEDRDSESRWAVHYHNQVVELEAEVER